jgi:hypothetical protein
VGAELNRLRAQAKIVYQPSFAPSAAPLPAKAVPGG